MDAVKIYEDAVRKLEKSKITLGEFEQIIAPLRNVIQTKHGKWIPEYKTPYHNGYYKIPSYCSCCKDYYTQSPEEMNFCPNCGADMRGSKDDID